uniref:Enoyl reductase (ER) domain-containing protein n=1 Tax=Alexandrium catenella TaxID=2925 RepID=A0A7S1LSL1_ALECA|mmetsp:Transcript_12824/g.35189  ORF Transcript_12824/g.35189 Transcript_12824/m.35189 type:complete len:392 (+) Transcript_12824:2-1177(+)
MATGAGDRLPLPHGQRCVVKEYGENQEDAIERCVVVEDQPPPLLSELHDGDLVVAVRAAEVVWTDTIMATGQYQHQPRLPYTPAGSYAGVVAWASEGAKKRGVMTGQRVLIAGNAGPRSSGRYQKWGGCASYAVAPWTAVRRVPESWSFEEAACFSYGYDTVHYVLVESGKIRAGETVLIHGASGGVGIPAVKMAKMLGATVIAATRSADKLDFLKSIGADHAVHIGDGAGGVRRFSSDVKALTPGGMGVDAVYDGVGSDAITVESLRCCKFGGRLLIVGWAATPNVARGRGQRGAPNANKVPTNLIMMKGLHIIGCPAVISTTYDKSIIPRRLKDLHEWTHNGQLPPPTIASRFPLSDVKSALRARMRSGGEVGSTVVQPPPLDLTSSKL